MSDCVGAPRMPVCRENHPFVCSTIKSPDNVPIEFVIENGASARIVFLNYQSQKHKHKRSRSRQHVFTALLDNARVNRADEKCKLVKTESDTMGACDHPTTGQPQRCGRFGSTLCYPYSRMICRPYPIGSANRSRACHGCQGLSRFHSIARGAPPKFGFFVPAIHFVRLLALLACSLL